MNVTLHKFHGVLEAIYTTQGSVLQLLEGLISINFVTCKKNNNYMKTNKQIPVHGPFKLVIIIQFDRTCLMIWSSNDINMGPSAKICGLAEDNFRIQVCGQACCHCGATMFNEP